MSAPGPAGDAGLAHVSAAPTRAGVQPRGGDGVALDVAHLFADETAAGGAPAGAPLDEKLRQAYFWMVNHAIISPHYDLEFHDPQRPRTTFHVGDSRAAVELPTDQSYSSFVLLPLLTFAVRGRCLLVGGPGRGKTASAVLMGVIAGYPLRDVRRAMQHGHPQLTVQDMFGTPLPRDLIGAERLSDIDVAWRSWLGMRVKIVDEYNRIPTRTQSALLTVLADGYVEVFDQVYETGASAWYLTANDDAGGGTFQVVDALRDRIDVVVKALAFNHRFLGDLVTRAERRLRPEENVPRASSSTPTSTTACTPRCCACRSRCRSAGAWSTSRPSSSCWRRPRGSSSTAPRTPPAWPGSTRTCSRSRTTAATAARTSARRP
ncbi:AAA family ATPase [Cellulomonas sp. JZ18]|uniref:AAA family ATPase n=1 Tax=Cellulomonas sp. JZ18 TaxID=2654191 RepID=UPI001E4E0B2F|nr:AAA family ATPase [Cellulomonas sp. JZ18]